MARNNILELQHRIETDINAKLSENEWREHGVSSHVAVTAFERDCLLGKDIDVFVDVDINGDIFLAELALKCDSDGVVSDKEIKCGIDSFFILLGNTCKREGDAMTDNNKQMAKLVDYEEYTALQDSHAEYDKLFTAIIRMMVETLGADYVTATVVEVDTPKRHKTLKEMYW